MNRSKDGLCSFQEASKLLGLNAATIGRWVSDGFMPSILVSKRYLIPRVFIETLRQLSSYRSKPTQMESQFCHLSWLVNYGSEGDQAKVLAEVYALRTSGEVLTTSEVAVLTGYDRTVILKSWVPNGFLVTFAVGGLRQHYFLRSEVMRLKAILHSLTMTEASDVLKLGEREIRRLVQKGKLEARRAPDGIRFSIDDINRLKAERDGLAARKSSGLTTKQAMSELDLDSIYSLRDWADAGLIAFEVVGWERVYDAADVARLKLEIGKMKEPHFDWIPLGQRKPAYIDKQVCKRLGISSTWRWREKGLLPYYTLTPPGMHHADALYYPKIYIDSLLAYAGGTPVKIAAAERYARLCVEQKRIMPS